ncbi:MAG: hypothetical protein Kow0068_20030 [Marinilabiliales bacterium]
MRKLTYLLISLILSIGLINAQTTTAKSAVEKQKTPIVKFEKAAKQPLKKQVKKYAAERNLSLPYQYLGQNKPKDYSIKGTKAYLYSNGPIVTNPGGGPGGSDYSLLEAPNNSFGFGHSISSHYMIADDVIINATSWTIDSIGFYAYQTGSDTNSTITEYQVMIFDGNPSSPSSSVVWGDTITNILSSTSWSGIYRGSDTTNSDRPVMLSYVNTSGLVLSGGEYWIAWRCAGSLTSGPWAPPITIPGQTATGNAMQWDNTSWAPVVDADPQGFPFEIYGTEVPASCPFPTNIIAQNVTDVSADISWTENGSATQWDIEYGVSGFTPTGTPTVSGVTANPYSLTGLTAGTTYDIYVRADCGGGNYSMWYGPYTFSTLACAPASQCIFTLTFNDSYGDGWNGAAVDFYQNSLFLGSYTLNGGSSGTENIYLCDGMTIDILWTSGSYDDECSFTLTDGSGQTVISFSDGSVYTDGDTIHSFTNTCPTCPTPQNLTVSNTTMTSADLGWTEIGSATTWDIEIGPTGFTPTGTPTNAGVTANPYTITGLTAGTEYDFYVRSDCGGGDLSTWAGPFTFHTEACDAVDQCYYVIDMHDSYGDGWNGGTLVVVQGSITVAQFTMDDGADLTDSVALCNGGTILLTWMQGIYDDEISFEFYDPFGIEVVSIADASTLTNGQLVQSFTASCTPPSCPAPFNLSASNMTTTSADLDWTPGGSETEWEIEYGPTGYSTGGTSVSVTAHPYTLTGLNVGTTYDYYVRAICGAGDTSIWEGPYTFNTQCDVISTFGWVDDFESGAIPCWSIVSNNTETWYLDDGTNSSPNSGTYDMVVDYDANLNAQEEYLYSPIFDLTSIASPEITFFWNMSYYWAVNPYDNYDVFLIATGDGGTTWDTLWTEPTDSFDNWVWYDTTLSLLTYTNVTDFQFAFLYEGLDGAAVYIDDVKIDYPVNSENSIVKENDIRIYPNPTNGRLYITATNNSVVTVYNIVGDIVYSGILNKPYIDISDLDNGSYIVKVNNGTNISTKKISLIK